MPGPGLDAGDTETDKLLEETDMKQKIIIIINHIH